MTALSDWLVKDLMVGYSVTSRSGGGCVLTIYDKNSVASIALSKEQAAQMAELIQNPRCKHDAPAVPLVKTL